MYYGTEIKKKSQNVSNRLNLAYSTLPNMHITILSKFNFWYYNNIINNFWSLFKQNCIKQNPYLHSYTSIKMST